MRARGVTTRRHEGTRPEGAGEGTCGESTRAHGVVGR